MIDTTEISASATAATSTSSWSTLIAVALMSFAALLLELGLTRLFSVVLFYHFAFLAISVALLGLGAGAVFACLCGDSGWNDGRSASWERPVHRERCLDLWGAGGRRSHGGFADIFPGQISGG